jgi:hypothetical protein
VKIRDTTDSQSDLLLVKDEPVQQVLFRGLGIKIYVDPIFDLTNDAYT